MDGITLGGFAMACTLFAASAIESRPVQFAKGATPATLKGS